MALNRLFAPARVANDVVFPLAVSANGRYLQTAGGEPFLINGDTPWQLVGNCTTAEITEYLEDRASKLFNALLIETPTAYFATQTPLYNNRNGDAPFTSTSYSTASFDSLNEDYWAIVDHAVNEANRLGIAMFMSPAYLGFVGGEQGWNVQVNAESDADLQTYGATLATRYASQANVVWVMGGDYNAPNVAKQWNIALGIRSVNPAALITYHGGRPTSAYANAAGQTGFNLNNIYTDGVEYTYAATEYARSGPLPFFLIEGHYESGDNAQLIRRQAYATILSGGCGHFYANSQLWGLGGYGFYSTAAAAMAAQLNSTGALDMAHVATLFAAYDWSLLVPKTDSSLITTALGSGDARIIGALASDGSFAMIWTPSQNFTVSMSVFASSSVRARWFNPTDGSYSTASGSPFNNTGTQAFTAPGERVLVLDAA